MWVDKEVDKKLITFLDGGLIKIVCLLLILGPVVYTFDELSDNEDDGNSEIFHTYIFGAYSTNFKEILGGFLMISKAPRQLFLCLLHCLKSVNLTEFF